MEIQKSHHEYKSASIEHQIVLIAENIRTPENAGMIMRLADAFGIQQLFFVGEHAVELSTKVKRASRNTYKTVNFQYIADATEIVTDFTNEGFTPIALEITNSSKPLKAFKAKKNQKFVVIVGGERQGVSETLLKMCTEHYHIPMFGKNSSINVVNALAVGLYKITENH
ncbi:TrmH family RNA methyltransferase [Marivirga salinae]|uniref:TrmH family RNA methyltransferase n=1 Tax=Marivirga salinarum TaxID=3059078 RepID=A0AA49GCW4_9BACT|nr:TrmH family RNA methyltransferase [Marivirga sp. BDSF4-3]WKK77355.2 TrmH family RNA methyltransferase [Marivirga sp. BDSF4-3]